MLCRRLSGICAVVAALVSPGAWSEVDFVFTEAISFADITTMPLLDITQAGERLVAVGERGLIIVSDDYGQNWRQASVPVSATLTAVSFPSARKGWAVGHAGIILNSDDGGNSWHLQFDGREGNQQYLEYTEHVLTNMQGQLNALSVTVGVATVEESSRLREDLEYALDDALFAQEDALAALESGPADPFLDVLFTSPSTGIAVGAYGMIYRTGNGGETWQLEIAGIDNIDRYHYYSLARSDGGTIFLSGEAGLLYRSLDAGMNWERVEDLYDGSLFGLIAQTDHVLAFGLRGNIFRSVDDGGSWSRVENTYQNSLYGGAELENGEVLLLGSGGLVLRANDASGTFDGFSDATRATFSGAAKGREGEVVVVGMNGLRRLNMGDLSSDE